MSDDKERTVAWGSRTQRTYSAKQLRQGLDGSDPVEHICTSGIPAFDIAKDVKDGDVIIHGKDFYQANSDIPSGTPFEIGDGDLQYTALSASVMVAKQWVYENSYIAGEIVFNDSGLLRANSNIEESTTLTIGAGAGKWTKLANTTEEGLKDHSTVETYARYDAVVYDGGIWRAKADGTNGAWIEVQWEKLTGGEVVGPIPRDYVNGEDYDAGEMVLVNDRPYVTKLSEVSVVDASVLTNLKPLFIDQINTSNIEDGEVLAWDTASGKAKRGGKPGEYFIWTPNLPIFKGMLTSVGGSLYLAKSTRVTGSSWNSAEESTFQLLVNRVSKELQVYAPDVVLEAQELFLVGESLYVTKEAIDTTLAANDTWDEIRDRVINLDATVAAPVAFTQADTYETDTLVTHFGKVYARNATARSANDPFSLLHFNREDDGGLRLGEWEANLPSLNGDIVKRGKHVYESNSDNDGSAVFTEGLGAREWTRLSKVAHTGVTDNTFYMEGDYILDGSKAYYVNATFKTAVGDTYNSILSDLILISDDTVNKVRVYAPGTSYETEEFLRHDGDLYIVDNGWASALDYNDTWDLVKDKCTPVASSAPVGGFDLPDAEYNGKEMVRKDGHWVMATGTGNSDFAVVNIYPQYRSVILECNDGRLYMSGVSLNSNIPTGGAGGNYQMKSVNIDYRPGIKSVHPMGQNTVVLMNDGVLWGWGNNKGVLGTGNGTAVSVPKIIATEVEEVSAPTHQQYHVEQPFLYIKKGGVWFGTGYGYYGRLGDGSLQNTAVVFTELAALPDGGEITRLFNLGTTIGVTFAVSSNGGLFATGGNNDGQAGVGDDAPTRLADWTLVIGISGGDVADIGGGYHTNARTLFLLKNGDVYGTGNRSRGVLGGGLLSGVIKTPEKIEGVSGVTKMHVSGGSLVTVVCEHAAKDKLTSWGYNGFGQCASGDLIDVSTPITIDIAYKDLTPMSAYQGHTYSERITHVVVKDDESIWVWGYGADGQAGDGTMAHIHTPQQLPLYEVGIDKIVTGVAGVGNGAAIFILKLDGSVYFVGDNNSKTAAIGMFGGGLAADVPTVTRIDGGNEAGSSLPTENMIELITARIAQDYVLTPK